MQWKVVLYLGSVKHHYGQFPSRARAREARTEIRGSISFQTRMKVRVERI